METLSAGIRISDKALKIASSTHTILRRTWSQESNLWYWRNPMVKVQKTEYARRIYISIRRSRSEKFRRTRWPYMVISRSSWRFERLARLLPRDCTPSKNEKRTYIFRIKYSVATSWSESSSDWRVDAIPKKTFTVHLITRLLSQYLGSDPATLSSVHIHWISVSFVKILRTRWMHFTLVSVLGTYLGVLSSWHATRQLGSWAALNSGLKTKQKIIVGWSRVKTSMSMVR